MSASDPLFWHRLQFGFTITFHYLFPQLTMGLSLMVLLFKLRGQASVPGLRIIGFRPSSLRTCSIGIPPFSRY